MRRLSFPPAFPTTTSARYEASTAIRQYSTGRSSVLGLSDDGRVWMWESAIGFQIKLAHVDMVGNKVDRVIAGKLPVFKASKRTGVLIIWAQAGTATQCTLSMLVSSTGLLSKTAMSSEAAVKKDSL